MKTSELMVGMYVKTKGARDRVGLRKIAGFVDGDLLVDHYRWHVERNEGPARAWPRIAVRMPYASLVMANKVVRVYELNYRQELVKVTKVDGK